MHESRSMGAMLQKTRVQTAVRTRDVVQAAVRLFIAMTTKRADGWMNGCTNGWM